MATNREIDDFVVQRWQMGHTVSAIRQQLLMLHGAFDDHRVLSAIKRYVDETTENVKLNRERLWLCRLRRALGRFR